MYGSNYYANPFYGESYDAYIEFDATSGSGYQAASASYSWTHTVGTGASQLLVVTVGMLSAVNSVITLTYNGVALTKLRADVSASTTVRTEIWYLPVPATGAHSVAVTLNTASVSGSTASSYNNVDQTTPIDAQNGGTGITGGGGGSSTISTTTVTNGAWLVDVIATADTAITATIPQVARGNITGAAGSAGTSEKPPNVIGGTSVAMGWDNIAALTTWTMSTVAIRPSTTNLLYATLTGGLSFIGSLAKFTSYPLTATLSFVGNLVKIGQKVLAGTLSFTTAFVKTGKKTLAGTLSFTGSLAKLITYPLTATLNFTGSLIKRAARALAGNLTFVGTLTKLSKKVLSGTVSFTTTFTNNTSAIFTATLNLSGSLSKRTSKSLAATLSFSASLLKQLNRSLSGSLSFIGSFEKLLTKSFTATLSFVGDISYWAKRVYRTVVKSTNKPETVKSSDTVEEVQSSGTIETVTTGKTDSEISTTQTDVTITTTNKDTET